MNAPDTAAGAAVYSPLTLKAYDLWVLGISNRLAWRCPTPLQVAFYRRHAAAEHLDVGVGTGYHLDRCGLPPEARVALLDLNPSSLAAAARRLARHRPETFRADVLKPLEPQAPGLRGRRFGSIGLNYLLHCLPGPLAAKAAAFDHLKPYLAEGGVLFGSTILGRGVRHNGFGRRLMGLYNAKGIFGNAEDDREGLEAALRARFAQVDIEQVGCVALFSCR